MNGGSVVTTAEPARPSHGLEFIYNNLFNLFKFISFDKQLERKQKRQQCENNIIKLVDFVVCDPGNP